MELFDSNFDGEWLVLGHRINGSAEPVPATSYSELVKWYTVPVYNSRAHLSFSQFLSYFFVTTSLDSEIESMTVSSP